MKMTFMVSSSMMESQRKRSMIHFGIFLVIVTLGNTKKQVTLPPRIIKEPTLEMAFKVGEPVTLPCVAVADPRPVYTWRKNDQPLTISNIDIKQLPGLGTIVIAEPVSSYEGSYQCIATNNFGSAMSVKTMLRKAVQDPFPSVKEARVHRPYVGTSLTLHCQPPLSYPKGIIYWGENKEGSKLKPIDNSERVSLDYDGNMYFSNVLEEDRSEGFSYICIVQNTQLRSLVQGDDQKIDPRPISGSIRHEAPKLMWPISSVSEIALSGQTKKMKCIFSGYPTPNVSWTREDKPLPSKVKMNSFGQEITIPDADIDDIGRYKCTGRNQEHASQSHVFILRVESPPFFKNHKPPEDVNTSEEESARFDCQVMGTPKPDIAWFINGVPIEAVPPDPRRQVTRDYIYYENVTKTDAQVIQCNASNSHGYIFANAYLNVLAEPPSFIDTPQPVVKVAVGQNITLRCEVFGAPKPVIIWKKSTSGGSERKILSGPRFHLENSGNLRISNAVLDDKGTYYCLPYNKFGTDEASGDVMVRSKTVITEAPVPQTVNASSDVEFRCSATTDPDEKNRLKIEWLKDGRPIDYEREASISKNTIDNSLKISQVQVSDSGNYTCNASNGLDHNAVIVKFTVKGRPDPPTDVLLTTCATSYAIVAWTSAKENNDPIRQYIVYSNTSYDEPGMFTEESIVSKDKLNARVRLLPWTNYTYHVKARNSLGISDRSNFSPAICTTPATKPYQNPKKVCTETREPDQLVIVWEPMMRRDHNGEGFHYVVSYRLRKPGASEQLYREYDWRQSKHVVRNQQTFQEYEITVRSENNEGQGPINQLEWKIGYSGQDTPFDQPQNFQINNQTLNSTSVQFLWDPVDDNPSRIRGFFRGYQIHFWKTDDPKNKLVEDVILRSWDPCPPLGIADPPSNRYRRSTDSVQPVKGHTNRLWPYSKITAGVLVLNAGKSGELSETIEFTTPEGVPSMVLDFRVVEKGSHHMKIHWKRPEEINGNLQRYEIEFRKAPPAIDQLKLITIENPNQAHKKIHDLQNETKYIFYIYAVTSAGRGPVTYMEEITRDFTVPSKPVIHDTVIGDGFVNISWSPVPENKDSSDSPSGTTDSPHSPGSRFFVEYKKGESDEWQRTSLEDEHNWINVTDLEEGVAYQFVVVARNPSGDEARSDPKTIMILTPKEASESSSVASAGWFIGLMCAIAFLLLILLFVCLIKNNRGGKYAVHEKEKLRGHDSTRDDDEAGFGEYTRTPHMELKYSDDVNKSHVSLDSEEKPLESESDSLGEYEDPDPSKFNEDGSFIGQYGGKNKSGEKLNHDATTPSALSTFV